LSGFRQHGSPNAKFAPNVHNTGLSPTASDEAFRLDAKGAKRGVEAGVLCPNTDLPPGIALSFSLGLLEPPCPTFLVGVGPAPVVVEGFGVDLNVGVAVLTAGMHPHRISAVGRSWTE